MKLGLRRAAALCALSLGLCAAPAAFAQTMSFKLVPVGDPSQCRGQCLELIAAEGEITDATPKAFVDFISANLGDRRIRSVVLFHSPGGDVRASMQLGLMLRKIGAATVVARANGSQEILAGQSGITAGRCYSACVYALMGGKKRVIPPGSRIGIHRAYTVVYSRYPARENNGVKVDPGTTGAIIARYSDTMGISRDLIATAQKTLPDDIHIATTQEIARWRLGTSKF